jgi:hypothetical protein
MVVVEILFGLNRKIVENGLNVFTYEVTDGNN